MIHTLEELEANGRDRVWDYADETIAAFAKSKGVEIPNSFEGHHGIPGHKGGSLPRGDSMSSENKAIRAKASYKPQSKEKSAAAWWAENKVVEAISGVHLKDNDPADVIKGKNNAVEVKSLFEADNDKLTCRKDRKVAWGKKTGRQWHTVAVDIRGHHRTFHYNPDGINVDSVDIAGEPQWYYKKGVGSFRLSAMQPVKLSDLKDLIK